MNLNQFFPYQVCINLDKRQDRWERITARFAKNEISQVVRFPAVDGKNLEIPSLWRDSPGAYGCLRSHLTVVEQARNEARLSVLIFEDDAVFAPEFSAKFATYVKQLPGDWDMVFFGGLHGQPLTKVADNVIRINHSLSTYAYALKNTIYEGFIELNRQALTVLDENTRTLQKHFNCYCFMPHLAWVEDDYSDIRDEKTYLWWLEESLVLFGSEIDEILKNTVAIISYYGGSVRNLAFTIGYFSQNLPGITLLVLEQGAEPSLNQSDFPPNCFFGLVEDTGCRNRSHDLKRSLELFGFNKNFFIFLDSDVFLTRDDIRANLLKCRDHDFVSAFREIYDLNIQDTNRILNDDVRWDYDSTYQPREKEAIFDSCCIVTRIGMDILTEREKSDLQSKIQPLIREEVMPKVYQSPNPARRLASS